MSIRNKPLFIGDILSGNVIHSSRGWSISVVGTFENGGIYEETELFKDLVGTYEGDEAGTAAVAYLLLKIDRK